MPINRPESEKGFAMPEITRELWIAEPWNTVAYLYQAAEKITPKGLVAEVAYQQHLLWMNG
jgi:hypothetical protein